jgi:hypothetical protein
MILKILVFFNIISVIANININTGIIAPNIGDIPLILLRQNRISITINNIFEVASL